jgi:hypothetical protein
VDGTVDPHRVILETIDEIFPADKANLVIDEAHATGYMCLVVARWSHSSGWWTACSPGCPRSAVLGIRWYVTLYIPIYAF